MSLSLSLFHSQACNHNHSGFLKKTGPPPRCDFDFGTASGGSIILKIGHHRDGNLCEIGQCCQRIVGYFGRSIMNHFHSRVTTGRSS